MNKEEMKKMVENAYEGYLEMADDQNKIVIDLNAFDDECKNEDGDLDLNLVSELNNSLIKMFEDNGYTSYKNGEIYAENGNFVDVNPDTVVVIK